MFTIVVENQGAVIASFTELEKAVTDFSSAWPKVIAKFYEIERELFASEGGSGAKGRWASLTAKYSAWKARKKPGAPIMTLSGDLARSLTGGAGSITREDPMFLEVGAVSKYGKIHMHDWTATGGTIPRLVAARPVISLTKEQQQELIAVMLREFANKVRTWRLSTYTVRPS